MDNSCSICLFRYQRLRRESELRVKKMEREFEEERQQLEREKKHSDKKVRRAATFVVLCVVDALHVVVLPEFRGSDRAGGRRAKDLAVAQEARARVARAR